MRRLPLAAAFLATAVSAEPMKLVVPDFNAVGPSREKASFFTEHISGRLSEAGAQVTTSRALQQLIGIERQRQLIGCASESGSCIAELASALGSDALLLGDIAQIDTLFQVNLKIVSGADGKVLSTWQARVNSEAQLLDELDKAAFALLSEAAPQLNRDAPRAMKSKGPSLRMLSIAPAALAVGAGVGAVVFFLQAASAYAFIPQMPGDMPRPIGDVDAAVSRGKSMQLGGWVCAGVATVGLAAAATMFLLGGKSAPVQATVSVSPGAATFLLGGVF